MLPGKLSFRTKLALAAWIGSGGVLIGLVPDAWTGLWRWSLTGLVMLLWAALAILGTNVRIRRRAARRAVPSGEIVLEQWLDHLRVNVDGGARRIGLASIVKVVATTGHVFVVSDKEPLAIPRIAFDNEQDMLSFAAALDT
ncbi:MAG: hypothetical protein H0T56_04065 [Pseudaminobacter sp.]|nr:hypothetical protein [Pseudaminobacter sp.]